jgi:hypothetical protein
MRGVGSRSVCTFSTAAPYSPEPPRAENAVVQIHEVRGYTLQGQRPRSRISAVCSDCKLCVVIPHPLGKGTRCASPLHPLWQAILIGASQGVPQLTFSGPSPNRCNRPLSGLSCGHSHRTSTHANHQSVLRAAPSLLGDRACRSPR